MPLSLSVWLAWMGATAAPATSGRVSVIRTPDNGIQPQAALDSKGVVHLIYYKGEPGGGDIFYVRRAPGQAGFSKPIIVNRRPGSAVAMGSIRGAQLAVGKNSRIHVIWDGMGKGAGTVPINGKEAAPLLYARLNDEGTAFEPERNLITYAAGLDGGSSIAADSQGNVYAARHAPRPGNTNGEAGRAVFLARSSNEGKTFQRETPALTTPTGACACCGMRAFADSSGAVYILFRAATEGVNRDEMLLVSSRPGAEFEIANAHKWKANFCPMSSATLTEINGGALAAWETGSQVYFVTVNPKTLQVSMPICPTGGTGRKHPVAVANGRLETLLVWTEGTAWAQGGKVAWQVYGPDGKPGSEAGRADGVPAWSLATAFTKLDGDFAIVY
ncbi:MAG TPA: hypothetical protein VN578_17890 [Candidatus Binatia bacterium]|nr:hypothetical protein [Candidatus Binatia bacterium]